MRPPLLVSIVPVQSFLIASSSSSCVRMMQRTRPFRSLRIICFRNFSRHAHVPPLKTPLHPRCLLQSLDYFWKPGVISCKSADYSPTPVALDRSFSKLHTLPSSTRKKALQGLQWQLCRAVSDLLPTPGHILFCPRAVGWQAAGVEWSLLYQHWFLN